MSVRPAVRGLPAPARAGIEVAGHVLGGVFGAVSRLRAAKSLHPYGVVHEAELRVHGGSRAPDLLDGVPLLTEPKTFTGVVRFSRSLGLPEIYPDILGLALRLPGAHGAGRDQDLLLVSSGDGAIVHHLFVPGRGYFERPYSSVLAFRGRGGAFVVGARLAPGAPRPSGGTEFEDLGAAAATGRLRYDVGVAPVHGRMTTVADLRVGNRLAPDLDALHFNPWNTGGGLRPVGPVNRMRDVVYRDSQAGWNGSAGSAG